MHIYMYVYSVPNNFAQLNSNFLVKIVTQIMDWIAICSN